MTKTRVARIMAELTVLMVVLVAIDRTFAGGSAFVGVNPNPLWLPVLAMAVAYGSTAGLAAAAAAIGYWLVADHPAIGLDEDPFRYMLARSLPPLLWVGAAVVVGELTSLRLRRITRATERTWDLEGRLTMASDAYVEARRFGRDLTARITADEAQVAGTIEAATRVMAATDRLAVAAPLARLVEADTQVSDFTLYLPVGDNWRSFCHGPGSAGRPDYLGGALVQAIVDSASPLCLNDPVGGAMLSHVGVMAVVARDGAGHVRGILLFHYLPATRFSRRGLIDMTDAAARLGAVLAQVPCLRQPGVRMHDAVTSSAA